MEEEEALSAWTMAMGVLVSVRVELAAAALVGGETKDVLVSVRVELAAAALVGGEVTLDVLVSAIAELDASVRGGGDAVARGGEAVVVGVAVGGCVRVVGEAVEAAILTEEGGRDCGETG